MNKRRSKRCRSVLPFTRNSFERGPIGYVGRAEVYLDWLAVAPFTPNLLRRVPEHTQ